MKNFIFNVTIIATLFTTSTIWCANSIVNSDQNEALAINLDHTSKKYITQDDEHQYDYYIRALFSGCFCLGLLTKLAPHLTMNLFVSSWISPILLENKDIKYTAEKFACTLKPVALFLFASNELYEMYKSINYQKNTTISKTIKSMLNSITPKTIYHSAFACLSLYFAAKSYKNPLICF